MTTDAKVLRPLKSSIKDTWNPSGKIIAWQCTISIRGPSIVRNIDYQSPKCVFAGEKRYLNAFQTPKVVPSLARSSTLMLPSISLHILQLKKNHFENWFNLLIQKIKINLIAKILVFLYFFDPMLLDLQYKFIDNTQKY